MSNSPSTTSSIPTPTLSPDPFFPPIQVVIWYTPVGFIAILTIIVLFFGGISLFLWLYCSPAATQRRRARHEAKRKASYLAQTRQNRFLPPNDGGGRGVSNELASSTGNSTAFLKQNQSPNLLNNLNIPFGVPSSLPSLISNKSIYQNHQGQSNLHLNSSSLNFPQLDPLEMETEESISTTDLNSSDFNLIRSKSQVPHKYGGVPVLPRIYKNPLAGNKKVLKSSIDNISSADLIRTTRLNQVNQSPILQIPLSLESKLIPFPLKPPPTLFLTDTSEGRLSNDDLSQIENYSSSYDYNYNPKFTPSPIRFIPKSSPQNSNNPAGKKFPITSKFITNIKREKEPPSELEVKFLKLRRMKEQANAPSI